jgi:hypothetical protein
LIKVGARSWGAEHIGLLVIDRQHVRSFTISRTRMFFRFFLPVDGPCDVFKNKTPQRLRVSVWPKNNPARTVSERAEL